MRKLIIDGIKAGLLIATGGSVFLACENRYIGSALFAVSLLFVCLKGYALFTGKVGFLVEKHDKESVKVLLFGLLGNIIATFVSGMAIAYANPVLRESAILVCESKLTQEIPQTLIRAFFCGLLMYLAVNTYREKNVLAGIFYCVPAFALSGFEHSIANMFYFNVAGMVTAESLIYLAVVVAGNSIGGMALPLLTILGGGEAKDA